MNVALGVSTGGGFGGIPVEKGTVIYLALEDTPRRLKERIKKMRVPGVEVSDNLIFYTEYPKMSDGLKSLEEEIKQIPDLRLVIIDTFAKFRPLQKSKNANIFSVDYSDISAIKDIADKYSISILVIHHLRKSESNDIMDNFSGTFGLTAAADGLLALDRKTGRADAKLHVTGRDIDSNEYALEFIAQNLTWNIRGYFEDVKRTSKQQKLYDALKSKSSKDNPISPGELDKITQLGSKYIQNALPKLTDGISIEKTDRGKYAYVGDIEDNKDDIDDIGDI